MCRQFAMCRLALIDTLSHILVDVLGISPKLKKPPLGKPLMLSCLRTSLLVLYMLVGIAGTTRLNRTRLM